MSNANHVTLGVYLFYMWTVLTIVNHDPIFFQEKVNIGIKLDFSSLSYHQQHTTPSVKITSKSIKLDIETKQRHS
jgi:hypothetical protein